MMLLAQMRPDLVCLSLLLPELSGYTICEYMRSTPSLRQVPVLVMSARATPKDRADAEEVGASAFLPKPFTHKQFVNVIIGILGPVRIRT
jgi:two-component system chemotaxis response regulator CheY